MENPTLADDPLITEAARRLEASLPPGSRVILFGSRARGDHRPDSDVDLLVVEPVVENRFEEMVRLRRVIGGIGAAVDVLVVRDVDYRYWRDTPNNLYFDAFKEGRTLVTMG